MAPIRTQAQLSAFEKCRDARKKALDEKAAKEAPAPPVETPVVDESAHLETPAAVERKEVPAAAPTVESDDDEVVMDADDLLALMYDQQGELADMESTLAQLRDAHGLLETAFASSKTKAGTINFV
ncbi:hypothetical protein JKP88DRAFT_289759 [Tribonema minus]|uniref:Uncharacterized protein n=1 Tax=Tribonema minus TaxID=303371 RepID=A0A836CGJ5_9STRA|nr:hypothetical protein JKP88DRAFT_289759 [Tribonema minus]